MFGLFKKKPKGKSIKYQVYRTEVTKYKLLVGEIKKLFKTVDHVILLCFFEDTLEQLIKLTEAASISQGDADTKITLSIADGSDWHHHGMGAQIVLAEVSPMPDVVEHILKHYKGENDIICHTSADNALFNIITGGRLLSLLDSLKVGESDIIQHSMIDKTITMAQRKMADDLPNPIPAKSLEEWVSLNLGPKSR